MAFTKGQFLTIKKRGANSTLKALAGQNVAVVRGGKNVTITTADSLNTLKVPAEALAASVTKSARPVATAAPVATASIQ